MYAVSKVKGRTACLQAPKKLLLMSELACFSGGGRLPVFFAKRLVPSICTRTGNDFKSARPRHQMTASTDASNDEKRGRKENESNVGDVVEDAQSEEIDIDMVDGLMENKNVRPMLDLDVDDGLLLQRLRMAMHKDDFNRIFNPKDRRIGDFL
jgi:hypothetical protein